MLGVTIVEYLVGQVNIGIEILDEIARGDLGGRKLPNSAWSGMQTIPKDVVLRIVALASNRCHKTSDGFPPMEILVHCNNYFVYICQNINSRVAGRIQLKTDVIETSLKEIKKLASDYAGPSRGVRSMLLEVKTLLQRNSTRLWPK